MGGQQNKKRALPLSKILVVAALILAVGTVFIMKQRPLPRQESAPVPVQTALEASPGTPVSLPRLVDLGSDRCQSCKAMVPVLEALTSEYDRRMDVVFVDVWREPEEADRYDIQLIPTQIFFDSDGKELFRHQGFFSKKDILVAWEDLGFDFDG
jgi:thioredoxin 1